MVYPGTHSAAVNHWRTANAWRGMHIRSSDFCTCAKPHHLRQEIAVWSLAYKSASP